MLYVASSKSQMTDYNKRYIYTGDEEGMTTGAWYFWTGSDWLIGGEYEGGIDDIIETDLIIENDINNLKSAVSDIVFYIEKNTKIVLDSWEQIIESINDGTYLSKYNIGDMKRISISGIDDYMILVAKDTDELSNGSGNAKTTWISKGLFTTYRTNETNTNDDGWIASDIRIWLREAIFPNLDSSVRGSIKEVTKTYYDKTTGSTLSASDTVWIPSAREIFGVLTGYETSGCIYSTAFDNVSTRVKTNASGTATSWWLRSAYTEDSDSFRAVDSTGYVSNYYASSSRGVALGFCI